MSKWGDGGNSILEQHSMSAAAVSEDEEDAEEDAKVGAFEAAAAGGGETPKRAHTKTVTLAGVRVGSDVDIPMAVVTPGDAIGGGSGFVHGHGTYLDGSALLASSVGLVERVNRVISVNALSGRYVGDPGDVVVGRVLAVESRRWRIDVGGVRDAVLHLAAVNLAGGTQRRRTLDDALKMRDYLREGDVLSADVQETPAHGGMVLHARSFRYGRLSNGMAISVGSNLVPRQPQHFVALPECHTEIVLGRNGVVWVGPYVSDDELEALLPDGPETARAVRLEKRREIVANKRINAEERQGMALVGNIIRGLAASMHPVTAKTIRFAAQNAITANLRPADLLAPRTLAALLETA